MPKNNKGKNAFYFFVLDWKKQQEKAGMQFSNGLQDAFCNPQCSEDWKNLSSQEKGYYNKKAKDSKITAQGTISKKTTLGESIEEVLAAEKRQQEFQHNMIKYIDSVISMGIKHNSLKKLKFIFIHVNWFYKRDIGINKFDFCPAEFAVTEFSLEGGTENIYHEIINVKIPLGWKRDAIETSQETHQININMPDAQSDFAYMYNKLISILEPNKTGDKFPPLFTPKDLTPAVESLLTRMTEAANASMDDFVIYSLENLFGALRNAAAQYVDDLSIPLVVAEYVFGKDVFSSVRGLECVYHKNLDGSSQYCSMSIVKRWGFTICDYCCAFLGMSMIEGVHYPMTEPYFNSTNVDSIDLQMNNLSISNHSKIVSMTGVGEDHRRKVSERSSKDEQRRRNECKPLEIIDHSKSNSMSNIVLPGRPLRPPKTTSRAMSEMENNSNPFSITKFSSFKDTDFPPMGGRGITQKKNTKEFKLPLGRGRGKC